MKLLALSYFLDVLKIHSSSYAFLYESVASEITFYSDLGSHFEVLLCFWVEESVGTSVFLLASHIRSLSYIILMELSCVACLLEVLLDLASGFTLVKSDLQASSTSADTLQVVLLNLCRDDVLDASDSLKSYFIAVIRKSADIDVNDFSLLRIMSDSSLLTPSSLIIDEIRRKETLLLLLGRFGSGWNVVCLLKFVVINAGIQGTASESVTVAVCSQLSLLHVGSCALVPRKIFVALFPAVCSIQPIVGRRKKSPVWFFIW